MKKVLAICLVMVMVLSMGVNAFAAPGGFVSSPSGNTAPVVVDVDTAHDNCTAELVVTPYSERTDLPQELKSLIEKTYKAIAGTDDLTTLNADLAKLAKDKKLDGKNLAVSDLFDIHATHCNIVDGHPKFDITLDAETLSHFVALLHMKKDGSFELIADAKVVNNGEHLQFSTNDFSPFAIVVDTGIGGGNTPQTGDDFNPLVYVIIMVVCAAAITVIAVIRKKQKSGK